MSLSCCYSILFDIDEKIKKGYLLSDYIGMRSLRMGEIEIGINAERDRMAKLVSMENAELKCSINFCWPAVEIGRASCRERV